ncbi:MAG: GNAT family N-acetyltransferase [Lewinellaceae bacterium]|nr:GNAT family N-acetyltransferase [Saprospiraceae bacterium]MCB9332010.1 GNAT family N-acetyltransferase [Lewinellaceae bacterium]
MIFQTTRLQIRPLYPDDIAPFHEMQGNLNVMRYTTKRAHSLAEDGAELQRLIGRYAEPGNDFWVWAIERKDDGAFVGTCALILNEDEEHEIGFRFLEKYWGQGYGTEVANGLVDYAMALPGVTGLVAYVYSANIGSVKVLDRSPLVFEREFFNEKENCMDRVYRLRK